MNVTPDIRRRMAGYCRIAAMLLCLLPALASAAEDAQTLLTVTQEGSVLGTFSLAALEAAGAVAVTVDDDSGQSSDYTGVPITQLLASVGIPLGKSVRGEPLAEFVMVRATDGYRVLFSLAETDPLFRERTLLLCYRKNGGPLPAKEGPLRVVVADEKRHARWVRQVITIELGRVAEPSPAR
jgi:DMSO/TMAO reductase YedYZ molybdopterin-dependent catalytic subunit